MKSYQLIIKQPVAELKEFVFTSRVKYEPFISFTIASSIEMTPRVDVGMTSIFYNKGAPLTSSVYQYTKGIRQDFLFTSSIKDVSLGEVSFNFSSSVIMSKFTSYQFTGYDLKFMTRGYTLRENYSYAPQVSMLRKGYYKKNNYKDYSFVGKIKKLRLDDVVSYYMTSSVRKDRALQSLEEADFSTVYGPLHHLGVYGGNLGGFLSPPFIEYSNMLLPTIESLVQEGINPIVTPVVDVGIITGIILKTENAETINIDSYYKDMAVVTTNFEDIAPVYSSAIFLSITRKISDFTTSPVTAISLGLEQQSREIIPTDTQMMVDWGRSIGYVVGHKFVGNMLPPVSEDDSINTGSVLGFITKFFVDATVAIRKIFAKTVRGATGVKTGKYSVDKRIVGFSINYFSFPVNTTRIVSMPTILARTFFGSLDNHPPVAKMDLSTDVTLNWYNPNVYIKYNSIKTDKEIVIVDATMSGIIMSTVKGYIGGGSGTEFSCTIGTSTTRREWLLDSNGVTSGFTDIPVCEVELIAELHPFIEVKGETRYDIVEHIVPLVNLSVSYANYIDISEKRFDFRIVNGSSARRNGVNFDSVYSVASTITTSVREDFSTVYSEEQYFKYTVTPTIEPLLLPIHIRVN